MQFVNQSFEILEQEIPVRKLDDSNESYKNRYLEAMYKHIERCGKTCYRAEHNITEDSYKKFVKRMIDSKHHSVLEHGVVYLYFNMYSREKYFKYCTNPYSKANSIGNAEYNTWNGYCTTNYRVIIENGWEDDLQYLCEPTKYHEKRHSVLLHSCIHCYKDLTRHRKQSFSIESTRYCNYSKTDKFGDMKFVLPPWIKYLRAIGKWSGEMRDNSGRYIIGDSVFNIKELLYDPEKYNETRAELIFYKNLARDEHDYNDLIKFGWQPQQAAEILPQATAADVVMSGFASDWEFIFRLRTSYIHETGVPHPLVSEIMDPLYDEFVNRNYINKLN